MKTITLLTTLILMVLTFSVSAQRQGPREKMTPEQQATKMIERMDKELQLNDKQKKDLQTYYLASFKKRDAAMQKNKDNRDAMREEMKKDREANEAQLKKVLTADQYKKYQANEQKRREAMKNRGNRR